MRSVYMCCQNVTDKYFTVNRSNFKYCRHSSRSVS